MYVLLPETENCTLEDIELHFANDQLKWTDTKIQRTKNNAVSLHEPSTNRSSESNESMELAPIGLSGNDKF